MSTRGSGIVTLFERSVSGSDMSGSVTSCTDSEKTTRIMNCADSSKLALMVTLEPFRGTT
jgi:hypothetical protein